MLPHCTLSSVAAKMDLKNALRVTGFLFLLYASGTCLIIFWMCLIFDKSIFPDLLGFKLKNCNSISLQDGSPEDELFDVAVLIVFIKLCSLVPSDKTPYRCFESTAFNGITNTLSDFLGFEAVMKNFEFNFYHNRNLICYKYDLVYCDGTKIHRFSQCLTFDKLLSNLLNWLTNMSKSDGMISFANARKVPDAGLPGKATYYLNTFLMQGIASFSCTLLIAVSFSIYAFKGRLIYKYKSLKAQISTCLLFSSLLKRMLNKYEKLKIIQMGVKFKVIQYLNRLQNNIFSSLKTVVTILGMIKQSIFKAKLYVLHTILASLMFDRLLVSFKIVYRLANIFVPLDNEKETFNSKVFFQRLAFLRAVSLARKLKRKSCIAKRAKCLVRTTRKRLLQSKHESLADSSDTSGDPFEILTADDFLSDQTTLHESLSKPLKTKHKSQDSVNNVPITSDKENVRYKGKGSNGSSWSSSSYEVVALSESNRYTATPKSIVSLSTSLPSQSCEDEMICSIFSNSTVNGEDCLHPSLHLNKSINTNEFVPLSFKSESTSLSNQTSLDPPFQHLKQFMPNHISNSETVFHSKSLIMKNLWSDPDQVPYLDEIEDKFFEQTRHLNESMNEEGYDASPWHKISSTSLQRYNNWRQQHIFCKDSNLLATTPKHQFINIASNSPAWPKTTNEQNRDIWSKSYKLPIVSSQKKSFKTESSFNFDDPRFDSPPTPFTNCYKIQKRSEELIQVQNEPSAVLCNFAHMLKEDGNLQPSTRAASTAKRCTHEDIIKLNFQQMNGSTYLHNTETIAPKELHEHDRTTFGYPDQNSSAPLEALFKLFQEQRFEIDCLRARAARDAVIVSEHKAVLKEVGRENALRAETINKRSYKRLKLKQEEEISKCNVLIEKEILKLHNLQKRRNDFHAQEFKMRTSLQWKPLELE